MCAVGAGAPGVSADSRGYKRLARSLHDASAAATYLRTPSESCFFGDPRRAYSYAARRLGPTLCLRAHLRPVATIRGEKCGPMEEPGLGEVDVSRETQLTAEGTAGSLRGNWKRGKSIRP